MPTTKTNFLLPSVFQTDTNKKFLNATLDQLVTNPNFKVVNGYIGRKFAPGFAGIDTYIKESTNPRADYQLEPSVIYKDKTTNEVEFAATYPEILQKLGYYGGQPNNQNNLWSSEYYTYNPHINLDAFINFSQYYWLPDGPDAVDVFAGQADLEKTFTVNKDPNTNLFNIFGYGTITNPDLVLVRGGNYQFKVNQSGHPFWIQTDPGTSGVQLENNNLSSRQVLGVTNNGAATGTVSFNVPNKTAQDFYINMTVVANVDLVTTLTYANLQGQLLSSIIANYNGIDGQQANLDGKSIIFGNYSNDAADWTYGMSTVPANQRYDVWVISLTPAGLDFTVTLTHSTTISQNTKVNVLSGETYANTQWYKNIYDSLQPLPVISANLEYLYYQDQSKAGAVGRIRLVDPTDNNIDVTSDILGKTNYISPNGVIFTNGLKIKFDSSVVPISYQNNEYYVEGVGTSIILVSVDSVNITSAEYVTEPDYITINRASRDINPWSRRNRWFHQEVIQATAAYNNVPAVLDQQDRAKRPIIEFEPNLQLFNFGKLAIAPVDLYDTQFTDPLSDVEGKISLYIDGIELTTGTTVIFSAATEPEVRNKVYQVEIINPTGTQNVIHLAEYVTVIEYNTVNVLSGLLHGNYSYWYNGTTWNNGQQRLTTNQSPLFDVIDSNDVSFGSRTAYPIASDSTRFDGTKIFNYKLSEYSQNDTVLGFPISYKSINNIGDIEFFNYFDNQTFAYLIDTSPYTKKINTGYLYKNNLDGSIDKLSVWAKAEDNSIQYQILSYTYDGINDSFLLDVAPKPSVDVPYIRVFVNYTQLKVTDFQIYPVPGDKVSVSISQSKLNANDRVDILVYTDQVSSYGFYQVPINLDNNSKNELLSSVTLGSLRNHIQALTQNSTKFFGSFPGNSNLRDLNLVNKGGLILQQSAPAIYSGLFLNSNEYNLADSVMNAQQEYTRFKNKFLNLASQSAEIDYANPAAAVDTLLDQINLIKNDSFPWYYSDMVPYGKIKTTIEYVVFDIFQRNYELTTIFSLAQPSNKAVLVYLNGIQLLYGRDYVFLDTAPAVQFTPNLTLAEDDQITIVEFNDTDGCYIPETPTKLGLYPKFYPEIFTDNTYLSPKQMLRGHDGSLTPTFGDFRDQLLLELEKRIFNNIKVEYDFKAINVFNFIPGRFRDTGYSLNNFNALLGRSYLQWTGYNNLDYVTNLIYDSGDPFTFNYSASDDNISGEKLQGSWRACFQYYYDTQRPHTHPWEMLGFSIKPDWWEGIYGPAPYTSGNTLLWQDLTNGYIAAGNRQGIDTRFARPELMSFIPVDVNGELKPPLGMLTSNHDTSTFGRNWTIGQFSPTELAWRNSSEYPFALQIAQGILNPGKYFAFGIATNKYRYNETLDQYLVTDTNFRLRPSDIDVNGYKNSDNTIVRAAGYLNWVSDYQTTRGIVSKQGLLNYVRLFDVKLAYRLGGFTSKQYIKVLAEQFSPNSVNDSIIIPDNDFDIVLHKSGTVLNPKYSGVIIEKTESGFKISGYDTKSPYFIISVPELTGTFEEVTVLNSTAKWYTSASTTKVRINYGTEIQTIQQMANFLAGYQLSLVQQGFQFTQFDEDLAKIKNWNLSLQEFMFWVQQKWAVGSILVLSPYSNTLTFATTNTVVDKVMGDYFGSKVVNQNFLTLDPDSYNVIRDGTSFKLALDNTSSELIGLADLNLVQYEHIIVFNNITQFNDVIYEPSTGARQFRLKLVGRKTGDWDGTLSAPGFMYSTDSVDTWKINTDYLLGDLVEYKNLYYAAANNVAGSTKFNFKDWLPVSKDRLRAGLIRNFATNSVLSEDFYNVDKVNLEDQFDLFSLSLIGYKNRDYLNNAGINDSTQVKFYQGFIKEKGSLNALNAVQNIKLAGEDKEVDISEEWAFRVGSYGSLETNQYIEMILDEDYVLNNPTSLQVYTNNSITYGSLNTVPNEVYKTSSIPWNLPIFLTRTNNSVYTDDVQTAGYVSIEDVDITIFDLNSPSDLSNQIDQVGIGTTVWVAKDYSQEWDIFRVSPTTYNAKALTISKNFGNQVTIITDKNHGLIEDDVVIIKSSISPEYNNVYRVIQINDLQSFSATTAVDLFAVANFTSATLDGQLFKLVTVRLDAAAQILDFKQNWKSGNKVWVDNNYSSEDWAVYEKSEPWFSNLSLSLTLNEANANLGSSMTITADNTFLAIGQTGYNNGEGSIATYLVNYAGFINENLLIQSSVNDTVGLGTSVASGNINFVAGSPLSNSGVGYVFLYEKDFLGTVNFKQILTVDTSAAAGFGTSIAMSQDDSWLYISSPGEGNVYVYQYNDTITEEVDTITADGLTNTYVLGFTPVSEENLFITNVSLSVIRNLVPYKDFTISGSTIQFTSIPESGNIVVRQFKGYQLCDTISSGNTTIDFGRSIACTPLGQQLVVGAPNANVVIGSTNYIRSGNVSVYDRSIEQFIANGVADTFTTLNNISSLSKVYLNQEITNAYTQLTANSIQFTSMPTAGSLIQIETNNIELIGNLTPANPQNDAKFGYSVDICSTSCSIQVGAPYHTYENINGYYSGAVYTFQNQGRVYGNITGTIESPTVTLGDSIRINDFDIQFSGTNLTSVVTSINSADIPGVTAANVGNYIRITSNSVISTDKLRILPGVGSGLTDLGLTVFEQTQYFTNPDYKPYDYFGTKVKIGQNPAILGIGSQNATSYTKTTFDRYTWTPNVDTTGLTAQEIREIKEAYADLTQTTFDADSTTFKDYITGSGAAWVYSYLNDNRNSIQYPGKYAFIQNLIPFNSVGTNILQSGAQFGSDMIITNSYALVGARQDSTTKPKEGKIYKFINDLELNGWDVIRQKESKVDIDSILKGYVYSAKGSNIIYSLDYIDPAKGKILGVAEQDITYKTDYDPAVYNNGSNSTIAIDDIFYWNQKQLGQVWWDLSAVRYLDYEQGSIKYRNANWGRIFPGSSIDVYEWTESLYPPSLYVDNGGDGEPKYPNNSAYVTISYVDTGTNTPVVKYYYWVKNKTNLVNPSQFGRNIPVSTIANYIRDPKNSGVRYFAPIRSDAVSIYNVNDNLTGKDRILHIDYKTKLNSNIIHNEYQLASSSARNVSQIPENIYRKIIDSLSRRDEAGNQVPDPLLPLQTRFGIEIRPRQSVFVDQNQAVKQMVDYVNSVFTQYVMSQGFDLSLMQSSEPIPPAGSGAYDLKVADINGLNYLNIAILPVGYKVLVEMDTTAAGLWTIYSKLSDNTWKLIRVQTYDVEEYWNYKDWYAEGYDNSIKPNYVVNTIVDLTRLTLRNEDIVKILDMGNGKWSIVQVWPTFVTTLGIQDGTIQLKDSLWDLENNFMGFSNERFSTDRFDKSPIIEIRKIMEALQINLFINQLSQEFVNLFFVLVKYAHNEQKSLDWVFKTSFITVNQIIKDLKQPKIYFKENQNLYQSYIEEVKPYRTTIREFVQDYQINDNYNSYMTDFDVPSTFDNTLNVYRSPSGQFPQDAALLNQPQYFDWNNNHWYYIQSIVVEDGGSGYTVAPTITITGSYINDNARARAIIVDGVVDSVEVTYPGSYYYTQPTITLSGGNGSGARIYPMLQNDLVRKITTTLVYDRVTYDSNILVWKPNTTYYVGNVITYDNKSYTVNTQFTSNSTFVGNYLTLIYANSFVAANDRIQSYYDPQTGMIGKNFGLLQKGIDYPGVQIEGLYFNESGGFDTIDFDMATFDPTYYDSEGTPTTPPGILDTIIESEYTDTGLTSRPGSIIIDGSAYVDQYSSHAPEELVPGRIFDTLDMTVTTFATNCKASSYDTWVSTTAFSISSIEIIDGGTGYFVANAAVQISGGGGSGVIASPVLDINGNVTAITVTSGGSGFTTIPNVSIIGANTAPARVSVRLSQSDYGTFSYRIFKDKNDNYQYLRVLDAADTAIAADVNLTATSLTVVDSSVLPMPSIDSNIICSVTINGERIVYFEKDDATNTLSNLRRGSYGTGANVHYAGETVVDSSFDQLVPYGQVYTWTPNVDTTIIAASGESFEFAGNATYFRSNTWIGLLNLQYVTTENYLIIETEDGDAITTEVDSSSSPGLYTSNKTPAIFVRQT